MSTSPQDSEPATSAASSMPAKQFYHGLMEGFSVQIDEGLGSPNDFDGVERYGVYAPRDYDTFSRMNELLLPLSGMTREKATTNYFPVMDLAPEIRLRIWEFAIADDTPDLIDFCHDPEYEYEDLASHPWCNAKCFFTNWAPRIKGVPRDYHKPLAVPGLNLLLTNRKVHAEAATVLPRGRYLHIQASSLDCASMVALKCPHVKTVAFPIPAFRSVLDRLSFSGRQGVQWWARYLARYLSEFPDNSIGKVVFWAGATDTADAKPHEQGMIYHKIELMGPELGNDRWNIKFTGSL
ncbi:uncharacterized protein HMPREF1541_06146 [Cyphellophora europaea CBS 101466]|uniref:Uncharacterized protein n=1 Tax=Cyphellophora europaea (strain CBS 101466) TaxID=1220924 RepID=W2RW62_CYPE1|nr:uncharacterized protein HMPREF1541_06146 [Cyphellophora europaea CBS 101466]ETN39919.1 hypothetical protein HMPREF1541_06146 [Cyphellophora europaea CBS 101466]